MKKLVPFTVVITSSHSYPSDSPLPEILKEAAYKFGTKMDIANPVVKAFLAGSFSGTCSTVLFQPLDLVKTRIQNNHNTQVASTAMQKPAPRPGMFSVVKHVLETERVSGLWRGIMPSVTRTVPGVGIYFGSLHWLKTSMGEEKPGPLQAIALGMGARSLAATIMIPITVLKTRFESGQFGYNRMTTALVQIYQREGVKGLTCGLLPTLVRDAPYSGLYLMFYTQLKENIATQVLAKFVQDNDGQSGVKAASHFACGLAAGFLASLVTHPADVIKTKMQVQPEVYNSFINSTRLILLNSGPRGFLIGFAPRMLRRTLMSAFAWTVYEEIMRKMGLK